MYIIIGLVLAIIVLGLLFILKLDKSKKFWTYIDAKEKERIDKENQEQIKQLEEEYRNKRFLLEKETQEKKKIADELAEEVNKRIQLATDEIDRAGEAYLAHKQEQINTALQEQMAYADKELRRRYREVSLKEFETYTSQKRQIEFQIENAQNDLQKIQDEIYDFCLRREAINQAIMREREMKEKEQFYSIVLSQNDIDDLAILNNIKYQLTNQEVINRAAYECYIKKPLAEMIKRVLSNQKISGIYKITYIPTGESYIGRSTDVAKRWTEHCKSAFNIGTIAHSSLHTRMAEKGIHNFTFELLEAVEKENLNIREKYYINLYGTKDYGMNMQEGG